ncbi:hypothetical protein BDV30DRAFT_224516 [Aspergillus minisclerotigenes]|uniref:F-box domain-containing protein n=1 Tax=Aspergillus minisclerotigenes TaxID=656917 RepID=A0A5N6JB69_9EURO|nr:hypothetical protein BDV30DRAFT_224516 [Aspergillus minisclerotigenes]
MPSSAEQTFLVYELTENIILQLDNPVEILRAQRVCRRWRDLIQTSPILHVACWYQSSSKLKHAQTRPISDEKGWRLNPAFDQIGVPLPKAPGEDVELIGELQTKGHFMFEANLDDTPVSWMTMLATQPPCQQMLIECHRDYSAHAPVADILLRSYHIESMTGCLLMSDVIAFLAECQKPGVKYTTVRVALDRMPRSVSSKVAIELPGTIRGVSTILFPSSASMAANTFCVG